MEPQLPATSSYYILTVVLSVPGAPNLPSRKTKSDHPPACSISKKNTQNVCLPSHLSFSTAFWFAGSGHAKKKTTTDRLPRFVCVVFVATMSYVQIEKRRSSWKLQNPILFWTKKSTSKSSTFHVHWVSCSFWVPANHQLFFGFGSGLSSQSVLEVYPVARACSSSSSSSRLVGGGKTLPSKAKNLSPFQE